MVLSNSVPHKAPTTMRMTKRIGPGCMHIHIDSVYALKLICFYTQFTIQLIIYAFFFIPTTKKRLSHLHDRCLPFIGEWCFSGFASEVVN